ncbi:MAG: hypothetical protein EOP93_08055 [Lysobacteraceae bacterium]|nr:MAG: hypothetical protein EOP93_08055 [Xanthomonadaceae bacterium]
MSRTSPAGHPTRTPRTACPPQAVRPRAAPRRARRAQRPGAGLRRRFPRGPRARCSLGGFPFPARRQDREGGTSRRWRQWPPRPPAAIPAGVS